MTTLLWTRHGDTYTLLENAWILQFAHWRDVKLKEVQGPAPMQAVVARKQDS
ncbi:MAG: hypothetical protein ACREQB_00145 [Candidatus Binataceae bacterium]